MTERYLRRGSGKTTEGEQQSGTTASDLEIILIPLGFVVLCLLLFFWRKKYNASFERALQASIQLRRNNENKEKMNQLKDKLIKKKLKVALNEGSLFTEVSLDNTGKQLIGNECVICIQTFQENDDISYSENPKCPHYFHYDCIASWLVAKHSKCPTCRETYLRAPDSEADTFTDNSTVNPQSIA